MRKALSYTGLALLALAAVGALLAFTPLGAAPLAALFRVGEVAPIDFAALEPPATPNWYLVCPEGMCAAAQASAPEFPWPAAELKSRFEALARARPRVEVLRTSDDGMQMDLVQRSAHMRFPDLVTVRFVGLGEARSTLAVYSRAIYGRSDFGVNQARVEAWLAALAAGG